MGTSVVFNVTKMSYSARKRFFLPEDQKSPKQAIRHAKAPARIPGRGLESAEKCMWHGLRQFRRNNAVGRQLHAAFQHLARFQ